MVAGNENKVGTMPQTYDYVMDMISYNRGIALISIIYLTTVYTVIVCCILLANTNTEHVDSVYIAQTWKNTFQIGFHKQFNIDKRTILGKTHAIKYELFFCSNFSRPKKTEQPVQCRQGILFENLSIYVARFK